MGNDVFFHAEPSGEMDERLLDEPASRSIVRGVLWRVFFCSANTRCRG